MENIGVNFGTEPFTKEHGRSSERAWICRYLVCDSRQRASRGEAEVFSQFVVWFRAEFQ